jgi:hypothetical protein
VLAETIRATDMAFHKTIVDEFNARVDAGAYKDLARVDCGDKLQLLKIVLKCADISNGTTTTRRGRCVTRVVVGRSSSCASKWTERVVKEFLLQGDKERAAGYAPSPHQRPQDLANAGRCCRRRSDSHVRQSQA